VPPAAAELVPHAKLEEVSGYPAKAESARTCVPPASELGPKPVRPAIVIVVPAGRAVFDLSAMFIVLLSAATGFVCQIRLVSKSACPVPNCSAIIIPNINLGAIILAIVIYIDI
jgi:hypothetical protein